jgi:hypothetical protein
MLKTRQSRTKTLTQVRAATLADVKPLLARSHVVASAVKLSRSFRADRWLSRHFEEAKL